MTLYVVETINGYDTTLQVGCTLNEEEAIKTAKRFSNLSNREYYVNQYEVNEGYTRFE